MNLPATKQKKEKVLNEKKNYFCMNEFTNMFIVFAVDSKCPEG